MHSLVERIYFVGFLSFFIGLHVVDTVSMFYFPITLYPQTLGIFMWVNWTAWGMSLILGISTLIFLSKKMGPVREMLDIWRRYQIMVTIVSISGALWWYNGTSFVFVFLLMPVIRWSFISLSYAFLEVSNFEGHTDAREHNGYFDVEDDDENDVQF